MSNTPSFLPDMLNLGGTWEEILTALYTVFYKDFISYTPAHDGCRVFHNKKIKPDGEGMEEGFWHVVSKDDITSERLIDFKRAKRLPWAKPLMESPNRNEIIVFDYNHGSRRKSVRRYIWLKDWDYVLILSKSGKNYYWITAFYIEYESKRRDLQKRYNRSLQNAKTA